MTGKKEFVEEFLERNQEAKSIGDGYLHEGEDIVIKVVEPERVTEVEENFSVFSNFWDQTAIYSVWEFDEEVSGYSPENYFVPQERADRVLSTSDFNDPEIRKMLIDTVESFCENRLVLDNWIDNFGVFRYNGDRTVKYLDVQDMQSVRPLKATGYEDPFEPFTARYLNQPADC
ncbi:MAG: hypothetical protein ABEJ56_00825 [Candidatus Nanohaloarchaea archaeon]